MHKARKVYENRNFQFIIYLKYPIRLTSNNQLTLGGYIKVHLSNVAKKIFYIQNAIG